MKVHWLLILSAIFDRKIILPARFSLLESATRNRGSPGVISMECAGRFGSKKGGGRVSSSYFVLSLPLSLSLFLPSLSTDFLPSWKISSLPPSLLSPSENVAQPCSPFSRLTALALYLRPVNIFEILRFRAIYFSRWRLIRTINIIKVKIDIDAYTRAGTRLTRHSELPSQSLFTQRRRKKTASPAPDQISNSLE